MGDSGSVRVLGSDRRPEPSRRGRIAIVLVAVASGVVALFGGSPATESERSAITLPVLPPDVVAPNGPEPQVAHPAIQSPLDGRVPGFTGTLVLTMATGEGTETWRWSSGPEGSLSRSAPVENTVDARPDPTGTWVLGIYSWAGRTRLDADIETSPVPVFWGATSFSWSPAGNGAVGWMEPSTDGSIALHAGHHIASGIGFTPTGVYRPDDPSATHRVVGFDELGFVIERVTSDRQFSVRRVDQEGTELGWAPGRFAGLSPGGQVAVAGADATQLLAGSDMEPRAVIERPLGSAVWAPDGSRLAVTGPDEEIVDIIEGAGRRSVEVGPIHPTVLTWDAVGRFVVLSGHLATEESVLVFIDTATLDLRSLVVSAQPVAAVGIP